MRLGRVARLDGPAPLIPSIPPPVDLTTNPASTAAGLANFGFRDLFRAAFGEPASPFRWQRALARGDWPEVLIAPTGSGKTAGVTLAWMHRRLSRPDSTPRRLVWCLPMRTLVDQAAGEVRGWLDRLHASDSDPGGLLPRADDVHILMGGADSGRWFENPERPTVIVGTQDMLLSRALMRGYASSRASWPMEFAVLHQDCQWVFDEVQLMNAGRATSAQLEAFRRDEFERALREDRPIGRPCRSLWISATLRPDWLKTVDHSVPTRVMQVKPEAERDDRLRSVTEAAKHLQRARIGPATSNAPDRNAYIRRLAEAVVRAHQAGNMTLVIVNQVKRAQDLHGHVAKLLKTRGDGSPALALLHSRFRPADRQSEMARVAGADAESDVIVVATQAVEAGVDISAAVMFTELAPWASMVQRFGRANRRGKLPDGARVHWVDLLGSIEGSDKAVERHAGTLSLPYGAEELRDARDTLLGLDDVAPVRLPPPGDIDPPLRVVRRKDLDDLFDTDADLSGFDVDISPYVRDANDTDVRVFWRVLPVSHEAPPKARGEELCAVPIGAAKDWIGKVRKACATPVFFVRDPQWRRGGSRPGTAPPGWRALREDPWPGLTILADVTAGGYLADEGFTGNPKHLPEPVKASAEVASNARGEESDGHGEDPRSESAAPVLLTDHMRHVVLEAEDLCDALAVDASTREMILRAARWHDVGKAHDVFQGTMRRGLDGHPVSDDALLAKTVGKNLRHDRSYFRHELASALAFLAAENWTRNADLGAFLIAAHHGKVRMNLRALPRERPPSDPERMHARFARGVWEGDKLPALELDGGERWSGGPLTLAVMELGWDEMTRESWTERTRDLLARHGPFRLAWLETLLRIADWRASAKEESGEYGDA